MTRLYGLDKLMQWFTVLLVAGMLPLSCIVHCHVTTPVHVATPGFYVCHPFATVDTEHPQHLHAQTVALRATHEVAIPLMLGIMSIALQSTIIVGRRTHTRWYPRPITPPPRYAPHLSIVAFAE